MTAHAHALEEREEFSARVVRTLHQTDHGFRIVRAEREDGREVVMLGTIPDAGAGEWLRVQGAWETSKYGPRLRVESASVVQPTTEEGLVECLSKMIDGVGPGLARRYVASLGGVEGTLAFLAGDAEIADAGFTAQAERSKSQLLELRQKWQARARDNATELALASLGLTPVLRTRVRTTYGPDAVAVCRNRPYDLAYEVEGFGFKRADELAQVTGIGRDSRERKEAALLHALNEDAAHGGHVFCPRGTARAAVARLCEIPVDDDDIAEAAGALARRGRAIVSESGSIGLRFLLEAEREIAALLRESSRPAPLPGDELEAVRAAEESSGLRLTSEQSDALRMLFRERVAIITGGPGVGKSTVTKAVCALWGDASLTFKLAAPTGRAARRLAEATGREATTIHRLLGYDQKTGGFVHDRSNRLEVDAILLDESSMVDVELMRAVLLALPDGCRVAFVGDADQLPPVGPGAPFRDLCVSTALPTTRLETVHRQAAGSRIIGASREILSGKPPSPSEPGDRADGTLFVVEESGAAACREVIVGLLAGDLAASFPWCTPADVQVVSPQRKGPLGVAALNDAIQAAINPRPAEECYEVKRGKAETIQFRIGDRVMQMKNDYKRGVVNGELGAVVEMIAHGESNKDAPVLSVRYVDGMEERLVQYTKADLHHLDLAYCTTVHKVQGAEFPAVVVLCHESHRYMLERSLLYTALTRAKKLCVLLGTRKSIAAAAKLARSDERRTTLHALMRPAS